MKKAIALLLALVLTLSLCACAKKVDSDKLQTPTDTENNPAGGENASNNGGADAQNGTDPSGGDEESEEPFDITQLPIYYQDLSEPQFVENQLTFQIFQAWYEDSDLVMDIHFINGHSEPVYDVWFEEFSVFNGDLEEDGELNQGGLILSVGMGSVGLEEPIPGNTYHTIRLKFQPEIMTHLTDLSLSLNPQKYSYEWGYAED